MASLVGRVSERAAIAAALDALRAGAAGQVVVVSGEPGIGKSRLLAELADAADDCVVLGAAASEFEQDLPYAIWTEAIDPWLAGLDDRRRSRLGVPEAVPVDLADRHALHRALRELLDGLAGPRPLVLAFDDLHWADGASVDAIAALVRRPPAEQVLLALAAREGQLPAAVATALAGADRDGRLTALALTPLSQDEAAALVGRDVSAIYALSGGNPFYLEALARVNETPAASPAPPRPASSDARTPEPSPPVSGGRSAAASAGSGALPAAAPAVPPAVSRALAAELAALDDGARLVLDAAAVVGDPFDPALAAETAGLDEAVALRSVDELLARTIVRPAGPRRFAFRHPVMRQAVYESTPGGWRLAAHARAAEALERRGAGLVARAHHVELAAAPGDEDAIALLGDAARTLQGPAPASAARFLTAALGLLPDDQRERRAALQVALAEAQSAGGDPEGARTTLLAALGEAQNAEAKHALTVRIANAEFWLGRDEDALRRLQVALANLPAEPSPDRVRLHHSVGLNLVQACDFEGGSAHASDALSDALVLGDRVLEAASLALAAIAAAGAVEPGAIEACDRARTAFRRLDDAEVARRLVGLWMLGWADGWLGRFDVALDDLQRAHEMASASGRALVLTLAALGAVRPMRELGRLAEAVAVAEEAVDRARLSGPRAQLAGALCELSAARLASGDVSAALQAADDAAAIDVPPSLHTAGQVAWCLGAALAAAGNPDRAVPLLQTAHAEAVPVMRPLIAADLVEAAIAAGDLATARAAAELAGGKPAGRETAGDATATSEVAGGETAGGTTAGGGVAGTAARGATAAGATPWAAHARAALLLAEGRSGEAAAAAVHAEAPPLIAARLRLLEGRALAASGDRATALDVLGEAEAALARLGARRAQDEAVRELRKLGHRVARARPATDGEPLGSLTDREREIATLVAAGRTNREVAEQLFLSPKTIEAHLRNVYAKLGVRSRVELARATELTSPRSDQSATSGPQP
ncbi:MAG TPA: AAA family ATPase [Solirubrobacteraceae bacterium]|nr:AAA family ATPase [Solirubrobacteraceae bacterium]